MFHLIEVDTLPATNRGKYSTVEEAIRAAKEMEIVHFYVFPDNGEPPVHCSF